MSNLARGRSLVSGVGLNDATYMTQQTVNGFKVVCPYYRTWGNMLNRCYGKTSSKTLPTYNDCSVSDKWLTFSNFKSWMEKQDWEGKDLDKDILIKGNRVYSEDFCRFVPSEVNSILVTNQAVRGDEPLGVRKVKTITKPRYSAQLQVYCPEKGRYYKNLGRFTDSLTAHRAWQIEKAKQIELLVNRYALQGCFLLEIGDALIERAWQLRKDAINCTETMCL